MRWSPARMPRPPEYCGKHGGDAELGAEVGDGAGGGLAGGLLLTAPRLVPALVGEVVVQVLVGGHDAADELVVGGERGELVGGQAREELDRILSRLGPAARADALEEIAGRRVPRPAQVAGEHAEPLDAGGQDGADVEASDGLHEEKHRGRPDGFLQTLQSVFHPSGRRRGSRSASCRCGPLFDTVDYVSGRPTKSRPNKSRRPRPDAGPHRAGRGDRRGRGGGRAPRPRAPRRARRPPWPVCRVARSRWDASP